MSSLFPKLPLFAGVLITAADSLIILLFFRSDHGRQGMLFFEVVIVTLVSRVTALFATLQFADM
jgi:metal iron transporter